MRDPAHAGKLRERVRFQEASLDGDGQALGPLVDLFDCFAAVESDPGPMRVQAMRLEGEEVICLTVRSTRRTRALQGGAFVRWLRHPARLYQLRAPTEDERRMWVEIYAVAYEGGAGA